MNFQNIMKLKYSALEINCDLSNPDLNFEQVIEQGIKKGANSLFVAPQVNRIQEAIDLAKNLLQVG